MSTPEEYIDFSAKYKDWLSIKRLAIHPDTKPEEVVFHLAGVRSTIDGKMFKILGVKTEVLDSFAVSKTSSLRAGYSSLAEALHHVDSADAKRAIEESCENKTLMPFAKTYLLNRLITSLKLDTGINQQAMSKVFPNLKPPKAPGRMGKAKAPV
ncbi:DUF2666 domain-containing protein [Candidatus Marsarchaeota archaeon]|jgi:hypothetical protein|nr:DUF2666 domain-containing protein [Candidatus Marsarchaeota archaeon]MCL5099736.1 DUF2666 domain-containing protein [Candidatus Marsarchaeota archaeon]